VGGGDREAAAVLGGVFLADALEAVETPGCEVNKALAASVRLKFWRTASRTKRS